MRKMFLFSLSAVFLLWPSAMVCAQFTLWDQQPDTSTTAVVDQDFDDGPDFSTFLVNDVVFGGSVVIDSITTYFTDFNNAWENDLTQGVVNIFDGDTLTAADDPTNGGDFGSGLTSVSVTDIGGGVLAITASNLNISLGAGTYWVGLTPAQDAAIEQEFHFDTFARAGFATQARNPGGGFGFGTDWFNADPLAFGEYRDASLTITGVPEPSSVLVLTLGLAAIVRRRR